MRSKKSPLVSIVMNCYNGDRYLKKVSKALFHKIIRIGN